MSVFQSPEFWSSSAFVLVVLGLMKPGNRLLKKWGQKQADQICKQQKDAKNVLKKAKTLKALYQAVYQNRNKERQKIMREANREIRFLEQEWLSQTHDRIARRNQETELRLKRIAENGQQDIKRKMLDRLVKQAQVGLAKSEDEDTDILIKKACQALEQYQSILKQ